MYTSNLNDVEITEIERLDDYLHKTKITLNKVSENFADRIELQIKNTLKLNNISINNVFINFDFENYRILFDIYVNDQERINNIAECLDKFNSIKCTGVQIKQAFFEIINFDRKRMIELGSFAKPLHEQIGCEPELVSIFEESRNALNLLRIQHFITSSEASKGEQRLLRTLETELHKHNIELWK